MKKIIPPVLFAICIVVMVGLWLVYLGFLVALLGGAIVLGNFSSILVVIGFFVITDRWYINFEEEVMDKKFGDRYAEYKAKTRRWL